MPDDPRDLLRRARAGDQAALDGLLGGARPDLVERARRLLAGRLGARLDASDVVQESLGEAYRGFTAFRGATPEELRAWLRRIVDHNVADALRDHLALGKRAIAREVRLDGSGSGADLHEVLAAAGSSPSARLRKAEDRAVLLAALETLPPDQREAVRLRHLEGAKLEEIASSMSRTPAAVAGLLKRGLSRLRRGLREGAS